MKKNKKKEKLEYRMYGLVNYQLSGIQKGIQYGHSKDEFTLKVIKSILGKKKISKSDVKSYLDWLENWKTYIILNGGTTNTNKKNLGTLNKHLQTLKDNDIFCTEFYEPDLGDQLTGVTFLVDERVFNIKKYPNLGPVEVGDPSKFPMNDVKIKLMDEAYGKGVGFMREFLKQFKLA